MNRIIKERRARRIGRSRDGITVAEVIVGLVVLTIGMLGTAGMLAAAGRRATQMGTQTGRSATETLQINRLASMPYDLLAATSGCVTVTAQPFPHTRCVSLTDITGGLGYKQVRLIITPSNGKLRADTVYLQRTKGAAINPLNM
jgi:hypothetical protein